MNDKYLSLYEIYLCNEWMKLTDKNFLYKIDYQTNFAKPNEIDLDGIRKYYHKNDVNLVTQLIDLLDLQIKAKLEKIIQKYSINNHGIFEISNEFLKTLQFVYEKNYWIERDIATKEFDSNKATKALNTTLKKLGFQFIKGLLNDESENYEWDFDYDKTKIFIDVNQNWLPLFKKQSTILEIEFDNQIQKLYYFQLSPYHNIFVVKKDSIFDEKLTNNDFDFITLILQMLTFKNPHNSYFLMPTKITSGKVSGTLLSSINQWKNSGNS